MLHQPRGQIPPLTRALTCLNAFKLPVRQTSCSLDLLWGCALALVDSAGLPQPLLSLQPRDGPNNGGWVVDGACHKGRWRVGSLAAGWAQAACQGKLGETRAGFHSLDKCTGREGGCRGASSCTAPPASQHSVLSHAQQGPYEGCGDNLSSGRVAACCSTAVCKGRCVLF